MGSLLCKQHDKMTRYSALPIEEDEKDSHKRMSNRGIGYFALEQQCKALLASTVSINAPSVDGNEKSPPWRAFR